MRKILASLALSALVLAPQAQAQEDVSDGAALAGLLGTPTAGLAPIVTPAMMGAQQVGLGYSFRYGMITGDGAPSNFGAGLSYGHTSGAYGLTLGYLKPDGDGVDGNIMIGANYSRALTNIAMSATSALNIGLDAGFGWASTEAAPALGEADLLSFALNVPVSTVLGSGAWRFVPYVQPGLGHGRVSVDDESESGTKFMVGFGLGVMDNARGIGLNVGMHKVFVEDGENVIGLGFSWNPKR